MSNYRQIHAANQGFTMQTGGGQPLGKCVVYGIPDGTWPGLIPGREYFDWTATPWPQQDFELRPAGAFTIDPEQAEQYRHAPLPEQTETIDFGALAMASGDRFYMVRAYRGGTPYDVAYLHVESGSVLHWHGLNDRDYLQQEDDDYLEFTHLPSPPNETREVRKLTCEPMQG